MRVVSLGAALVASASFFALPAAANGRIPQSNQIVFSPSDPNLIVGRTTYAILPSKDNGTTWGYLCEDVLGLPSKSYEDPELGLTANNALVAGLFGPAPGLDVSNDVGCNWTCIGGPLAGQQVADTVVRPDAAHQVLALTSTAVVSDAGAALGHQTQVFQSVDDGATWSALGVPLDPTFQAETIDVPVGDPMRIYVSGERSKNASLFVSSDGGQTWAEHVVPQYDPANESGLFIGGIDPTNENRVYLRSQAFRAGGDSRLYVTSDGGGTFATAKDFVFPAPASNAYVPVGELLGFALSPDGSKVFVGSKESGLWTASRDAMTFTQVNSKVQVLCLASRQTPSGPELWACSTELGGFIFGKSTDDGVTFDVKMATVTSMNGPVACAPTATSTNACGISKNGSTCTCAEYQEFCTLTEAADNACLGCGVSAPDAGSNSGIDGATANDAGPSGAKATSNGCGCSMTGGTGYAGSLASLVLAAIALLRRKRT